MTAPALHPDLEPLRALLGTWAGPGSGSYPTIEPFGYVEEITFGHVGKPFLAYRQKTRDATSGLPLHAEAGYWRPAGPGRLEVVLSHPSGLLELQLGTIEAGAGGAGAVIELRSSAVVGTPTAKPVTEVHRRFELSDDGQTISYDLSMAAMGQPLTHHLHAELRRQA